MSEAERTVADMSDDEVLAIFGPGAEFVDEAEANEAEEVWDFRPFTFPSFERITPDLARFAAHGAHCHTVAMGGGGKSDIYRELARRVRGGLIAFPEDPVLLAELRRLRIRYGGQRPSIENPRAGGGHGDVAQALAQAVGAFAEGEPVPPVMLPPLPSSIQTYSQFGQFG